MYAHYFASKGLKYIVISSSPRPVGEQIAVKGKVEARKVAKQHNASPYNF